MKLIAHNVSNFCHENSMDNISVEVSDNSELTKVSLFYVVKLLTNIFNIHDVRGTETSH
jgi:hypothetical protein